MGRHPTFLECLTMNPYLKGFLLFIAYNAALKIAVKPVATSMNIPLLTTIVS
jgi:hypothetical protein